jgi:hypothetical protein
VARQEFLGTRVNIHSKRSYLSLPVILFRTLLERARFELFIRSHCLS